MKQDKSKLQVEFQETVSALNNAKKQLQSQQEICNKLNNQLQELSESFTNKCNDIQHQQQESSQLKNDVENITKQRNEINASLNLIQNERDHLLNNLIVHLNAVKIIRAIQTELLNSVDKLQKEVTDEFNEIKLKISKDLMFQVRSVLKIHEEHDRQIYELQCKSKEENDSYNSKIKSLQAEIQNTDKLTSNNVHSQSNVKHQEVAFHSKQFILEECDIEVKLSELNNDILSYKNRCRQLELSLNHALLIMKSIHNGFDEKSKYDNSVLTEERIVHRTIKDEQITAIKAFIDEHNTRDLNNKYCINQLNTGTGDNVNDNLTFGSNDQPIFYLGNDETLATSEVFNKQLATKSVEVTEKEVDKINSTNISSANKYSLEIQQLKQEIILKEDVIKKLRSVVEKLEQEKEVFSSKIVPCDSKVSDSVLNSESVLEKSDRHGTDRNIDDHINWLQQENKTLSEKLETMKTTYEKNIEHLTDEYESIFKGMEEDRKIDNVLKSGKEKKFILNEMKEQIENLQHDLDQRGDAFEKLYEEHQQTLKSKDDNVRQMRLNYEKEMREQDKKWRSCLDRKLAEEELRHKEEMTILSSEWAAEKKELEMASQLAVSVVESGSSSSDLLRRQVQSLTLQVTQLQNERCNCKQRKKSPTPLRIQDCTEMEYLRNILYDYMMGKEPMVLAKVLCALMKFSDKQTNTIVSKEEQRLTLLGQLGIM